MPQILWLPSRGQLWIAWLWRPGGLVLLSPLRLQQLKAVLGRPPPPVHCAESRLKPTPSLFFEKEAYLPLLELWPEGQTTALATMGPWSCAQGTEAGGYNLHSPSVSPQLPAVSQKRAYTFVWHHKVSICHQDTHLYHLALVAKNILRSHRSITNREYICKQLPHLGPSRGNRFKSSVFL